MSEMLQESPKCDRSKHVLLEKWSEQPCCLKKGCHRPSIKTKTNKTTPPPETKQIHSIYAVQ